MDRYVRIYRKDNPPCELELAARKRGDPWNEEIKRQLIEKVGSQNTGYLKFVGHNPFRIIKISYSTELKVGVPFWD